MTDDIPSHSYQRTSSTDSVQIHYTIRRRPYERAEQALGRYVPA
jgi:hypothetical protein